MSKEIRISHAEIDNAQTITQRNIELFKEHGLDIHVNEVVELEDDYKRKERILKIKNTKYFT